MQGRPCPGGVCGGGGGVGGGGGGGGCKGTENFQVKEFDITENGQWHYFGFSINSQPPVQYWRSKGKCSETRQVHCRDL